MSYLWLGVKSSIASFTAFFLVRITQKINFSRYQAHRDKQALSQTR